MTKIDKIEDFIAWLKEQPAGTKFAEKEWLSTHCPLAIYSGTIVGVQYSTNGDERYDLPKWAARFARQANYGITVEDAIQLAESLK